MPVVQAVIKTGSEKAYPKISHVLTKIFQPLSVPPKDAQIKYQDLSSKSQRLMSELGLVKQSSPGCFTLLPLAVRAQDKLVRLVEQEFFEIGAQKLDLPTLTRASLWKTSGRFDEVSSELFKVTDRHDQGYVLSPTHEEAAADLLATIAPVSYKQLPLLLYQVSNKFRDEMKPRFGLLRGKQFLMNDLYSFDCDADSAKQTYENVGECYRKIFERIGVDFVKVLGDAGYMGGSLSHEYHFKTNIGEDKIIDCSQCNHSANLALTTTTNEETGCPKCGSDKTEISSAIEVGHTFLLGDKYSKPLKSMYLSTSGKPDLLQMGSYGLGLSRILAAALEVLSTDEQLRWPSCLAPYRVMVIPPKKGSKEETHLGMTGTVDRLYANLETLNDLENDVLLDDRTSLTIGRRCLEAQRLGYPFIVVIGNRIMESPPMYEIHDLKTGEKLHLTENNLLTYIKYRTFV